MNVHCASLTQQGYSSANTVLIIENLSRITAGSLMAGTSIISVQRPISPGLIKDLWIMPLHPKTSEVAKEQERKVEPLGIEPRAIGILCQCSPAPSCDSAQILNDHNHMQLISSSNQIQYYFRNTKTARILYIKQYKYSIILWTLILHGYYI